MSAFETIQEHYRLFGTWGAWLAVAARILAWLKTVEAVDISTRDAEPVGALLF